MAKRQTIELLAPARDLACGMAAIDHGADAVYIGAQRFGARMAAGNPVADIAALCRYARPFGVKVYVTVNTIVFDEELGETEQLLEDLRQAGADAILVQDMGILELRSRHAELRRLSLHASTQTDNRTAEKVKWLRSLGFRRVVLARELSVEEIRAIHEAVPDVELEVFVHGALCVSYSGQCYASAHCFGRSANRGACAQMCRLKFDLVDADGRMLEQGRYLLSLKDLCQIEHLEELMEAGAVSFKIEGRLKDAAYVKNVTAAYSQRLDRIIARHPDRYERASRGSCTYTFAPNLKKTFNRGFTTYFLHGRQPNICSPDTPKAMGEYVGRVKEIRHDSFNVAGTASFANGDGLCFVNDDHELEGFRVNKAVHNRLFPLKMPSRLLPGMALYRNNDQEFERLLAKPSGERKMELAMTLAETERGFSLAADGVAVEMECEKQLAQKPQRENIERQLARLGGTPYLCKAVNLVPADFSYFIPSSQLASLRRRLTEALDARGHAEEPVAEETLPELEAPQPPDYPFGYLYNAGNHQARAFYAQQGVGDAEAFETAARPGEGWEEPALLMQCRHCLKYSLGCCARHGGVRPRWREPLFLVSGDGRCFRLAFDCNHCQMNVYATD